ncbi:MAG: hypothetical protein GY754_40915 [bacterium]|nr:hypothetical protein [bacterium]
MRKYLCPLIALLFIIGTSLFKPSMVNADLKDFKKDVEREEKTNKSSSDSSGSSCGAGCVSDFFSGCFELFTQAAATIWVDMNMAVHYSDYPYKAGEENNFIQYDPKYLQKKDDAAKPAPDITVERSGTGWIDPQTDIHEDEDVDESSIEIDTIKNYFYTIEAGGQWARDYGGAYSAAIGGRFWKFIGPEMEFKHTWDGSNHLVYIAAGINIPIIQHDYCTPDIYVQGSFMRGIISKNGVAFGLIFRSYPVKPLSLMFRLGTREYGSISFIDLEGRVGVILNRVEIFAGYRHITSKEASIGGPLGGIKVFF